MHGTDPLVQLGVWTAAGFLKRVGDGDEGIAGEESVPIPGITVVGHEWELHVGYMDHQTKKVVSLSTIPHDPNFASTRGNDLEDRNLTLTDPPWATHTRPHKHVPRPLSGHHRDKRTPEVDRGRFP